MMTRPCGDALVLITSRDPSNSRFGTGFAICERGGDTIALTCAHVVVDVGGPGHVRADEVAATVVAQGDPDGADIAVLRLSARTGRAVLELGAEAEVGDLFDTTGFQHYGNRTLLRNLHGRLSSKVALAYRGTGARVDAWDIDIISTHGLQPGYSGAPVVGPDGRVVGIITDRQGEHAGLAISVGCLTMVWKEKPDGFVGCPQTPAAHLVTNREYLDFVRNSGHRKPLHWNSSHPPFPDELREAPITGIPWNDAIAYCDWLGAALPGPSPGSAPGAEQPSGRNHGIAEWYDAGSEDRKEVRDPRTGVLVDLVARGARRRDIGFRCIPPHAASPPTWVLIEQGSCELGTDVPSFSRIAASDLPADLQIPILRRPVRRFDLDEFKISATCVTNEEFFSFTRHNSARWPPGWSSQWLDGSEFPFPARLASRPVVNVSAEEAEAYCVWSRTRLPSWAEWERAAAGLQRRPYPWGAEYYGRRCNSRESGRGSLAAADAYPDGDTPEGAHQLCGNVAEWVVDPSGGFETRGGSYRMSCQIWGLTYAFRQAEPRSRAPDIGFRVVSD